MYEILETTDSNETRQWMRTSDLKTQTEALICAVQEQAVRTSLVKHNIDKTAPFPLCSVCGNQMKQLTIL